VKDCHLQIHGEPVILKDELAVPVVLVEPTFDHHEIDHALHLAALNRGIV
jgi:hypothetical protein